MHAKNVALVLSSGGARGYAHIGAIEALHERGYHIGSVAGTSMGALIGGMYCAGKLDEIKKWLFTLDKGDVFSLIDWSISKNYLLKGEKLMNKFKQMVPDVNIEDLEIPFRAVAADLETQREVVFSKHSLYRAIRASVSIPSVIKPIKIGKHILVDGGVANALPLNRVVRHEGDLLVSVNVSAPASEEIEIARENTRKQEMQKLLSLQKIFAPLIPDETDSNYFTLVASAFALLIQRNTVLQQKLHKPDIAVNIPMNRFGVFDFIHAESITQAGYEATMKAIDEWKNKNKENVTEEA